MRSTRLAVRGILALGLSAMMWLGVSQWQGATSSVVSPHQHQLSDNTIPPSPKLLTN
jgi:hypothetical protein